MEFTSKHEWSKGHNPPTSIGVLMQIQRRLMRDKVIISCVAVVVVVGLANPKDSIYNLHSMIVFTCMTTTNLACICCNEQNYSNHHDDDRTIQFVLPVKLWTKPASGDTKDRRIRLEYSDWISACYGGYTNWPNDLFFGRKTLSLKSWMDELFGILGNTSILKRTIRVQSSEIMGNRSPTSTHLVGQPLGLAPAIAWMAMKKENNISTSSNIDWSSARF